MAWRSRSNYRGCHAGLSRSPANLGWAERNREREMDKEEEIEREERGVREKTSVTPGAARGCVRMAHEANAFPVHLGEYRFGAVPLAMERGLLPCPMAKAEVLEQSSSRRSRVNKYCHRRVTMHPILGEGLSNEIFMTLDKSPQGTATRVSPLHGQLPSPGREKFPHDLNGPNYGQNLRTPPTIFGSVPYDFLVC